MPGYELAVIFRVMQKPELVATLKRTAETIWSKGGYLRKLDNLGTKDLPCLMKAHGKTHRKGSYFVFYFDSPPTVITDYKEFFKRDVDVIRKTIVKQEKFKPVTCTLHEELLPPAYRKDVQELLTEGKRNKRQLFKPYVLEIESKPF